ncbi:hypothetical protein [Butyricicoccus sp.]|uniref:hypothetical protein n=1 Tax=Butyricicoccus sp. TaxID=2049021 RepID=UPI0037360836
MAKKQKRGAVVSARALPNLHARDRWFTAAKILLTISPLISLAYLQAAVMGSGLEISEMLTQNPELTVSFLASMTGPFIAYLMKFVQKHLYDGDAAYAMTNLMLMTVAEAMLYNTFYFILMIVLMYFVFDMTGVHPIAAIRQKLHDHFWRDISGSIFLLILSAFCMFVSMRLGMR